MYFSSIGFFHFVLRARFSRLASISRGSKDCMLHSECLEGKKRRVEYRMT